MKHLFFTIVVLLFCIPSNAQRLTPLSKNRLFVMTDIGNEPDDSQTMVRLMLYSNVIDIEGLVASTSIHKKSPPEVSMIRQIMKAYGEARPHLLKHEKGFPTEKQLLNLVKAGQQEYGMKGVQEGKNSEGSDLLVKAILKEDSRPLWISVWGGLNTLAQALLQLQQSKSKNEMDKLIKKLRVYTISDQDDAGFWIRENFPDLFYIVSPNSYQSSTWIGMAQPFKGANNEVISNSWIEKNIQQGKGSLGRMYPDVSFGMEGDTPSWLGLIPNGLNNMEHPDWGGWGGRYQYYQPEFDPNERWLFELKPESHPIWTNTDDTYTPLVKAQWGKTIVPDSIKPIVSNQVTIWRWREDFQNDFAARMDWCVKNYKEANHPPIVKLSHPETLTVKSGEHFELDARLTEDPDGDALSFYWMQYPEVSSYKRKIVREPCNVSWLFDMKAPKVTKPETVHIILKVTDKGSPQLTRYKRVIINILPK